MSLFEFLREQRIKGKVLNKFQYDNGNLGLIVEDETIGQRYLVEFRTDYIKPGWENLYKIINEPFKAKKQYLDQLIEKDTYVDISTSYSKNPIKYAYHVHTVSSKPLYKRERPKLYQKMFYQPAKDKLTTRLIGYGPWKI